MKWEFVPAGNRLHWGQQRCWAPAVSLIASSPPEVEGLLGAPQIQFLQPSFLLGGQPLGQLYTQPLTVHASRVCFWAQAEPWGGQYLPQCTVAMHHGQSKSSFCCSTTGEKETISELFKYKFINAWTFMPRIPSWIQVAESWHFCGPRLPSLLFADDLVFLVYQVVAFSRNVLKSHWNMGQWTSPSM